MCGEREREREREREPPLLEGGESERESDVYIIITTQTGEIEHEREERVGSCLR